MDIDLKLFDIKQKLGEGGMAEVYLATYKETNKEYAIKLLNNLENDANAQKRFVQEAKVVSALKHSNIVKVYGVGKFGKKYYIVMDYIKGRELKKLINNKPLQPRFAIEILYKLSLALTCAHNMNIIHRDIKASNILMKDNIEPILMDFGIAKNNSYSLELTKTGAVIGTPQYISPEGFLGKEITPASDIYSLGILFFEMLMGYLPIEGENPLVMGNMHVKGLLKPLSPELNKYEYLFKKMTAVDLKKRISTAEQLSALLKHFLNNQNLYDLKNISSKMNVEPELKKLKKNKGYQVTGKGQTIIGNFEHLVTGVRNNQSIILNKKEKINSFPINNKKFPTNVLSEKGSQQKPNFIVRSRYQHRSKENNINKFIVIFFVFILLSGGIWIYQNKNSLFRPVNPKTIALLNKAKNTKQINDSLNYLIQAFEIDPNNVQVKIEVNNLIYAKINDEYSVKELTNNLLFFQIDKLKPYLSKQEYINLKLDILNSKIDYFIRENQISNDKYFIFYSSIISKMLSSNYFKNQNKLNVIFKKFSNNVSQFIKKLEQQNNKQKIVSILNHLKKRSLISPDQLDILEKYSR